MEKTLEQERSDCLKIVLFGPESTGKTTLSKALAAHYNTEWVPEYMRTYLQEKWDEKQEKITKSDLLPIAKGQIAWENEKAKTAQSYLFCDTNLRELKVYCEYYYQGFCPEEIVQACKEEDYSLYLLTYIDIPWIADDLRDHPHDRQDMFRIFESELQKEGLPYKRLEGDLDQRLSDAVEAINQLKPN